MRHIKYREVTNTAVILTNWSRILSLGARPCGILLPRDTGLSSMNLRSSTTQRRFVATSTP